LQLYYYLVVKEHWSDHKTHANRVLPLYWMLQKRLSCLFLYAFVSNHCSDGHCRGLGYVCPAWELNSAFLLR